MRNAIAEQGSARVIVHLRTETRLEADLSASQVDAQRADIADALDALAGTLAGTGSEKLFEFDVVPSAVYEIGEDGLDALLADPTVASVTLDGQVQGQLDSSTGVIDSDLLNTAGVLGDNFDGSATGAYQVAIIDSGVDGGHNAFAGRIVNQACFVGDFSCPGGTNAFIGAPGGEECTHSDDCDHGTHVGGIAAGAAYTDGHEGVARGARIVAIKVAQDSPTSNRVDGVVLVDRRRPPARDQPQDVHQPQPGLGQPEHRHQLDVLGGRPGVRRPRPDHRRPVRPAAGPGRGRGGGGGQQRRHRRDELPGMSAQRLRHRRHRRRRRPGELHQLERRTATGGRPE